MGNEDLEKELETLPDIVAKALENWRIATLQREKIEALIHIAQKGDDEKKTMADIKAAINCDESRCEAVLLEIKAEAAYMSSYENLMGVKKRVSLRIGV